MSRVKGGVTSAKRRRNILVRAKGFRHGRSTKVRLAKESLVHAGKNAFAHRRDKKNDFKRLWNVRINGGLDTMGGSLSYSRLMGALRKKGVLLNRKMLATLAEQNPESFARIIKKVS